MLQNISAELSEKAMDYLADKGYDPDFGARPLKRLMQNKVENFLAQELLEGKLLPGKHYLIDVDKDNIIVTEH
jgi:ATP-dependent Clp protease ATP-binding subunit ClpA